MHSKNLPSNFWNLHALSFHFFHFDNNKCQSKSLAVCDYHTYFHYINLWRRGGLTPRFLFHWPMINQGLLRGARLGGRRGCPPPARLPTHELATLPVWVEQLHLLITTPTPCLSSGPTVHEIILVSITYMAWPLTYCHTLVNMIP